MKLFSKRVLLKLFDLYPPYLGAGIRVKRMDADMRAVDVEMKLRFWNANYVGTQFGGSLFSMADPFYMLMLMENLGPQYRVWDKAATIRFRQPGRGTVRAEFRLTEERIQEIKDAVQAMGKTDAIFQIEIKNLQGEVVADVEKVIQVRRRSES